MHCCLDTESDCGVRADDQLNSEPLTFAKIETIVNKCAKLLREMIATYHVSERHVQDAWFSLLDAVVRR